MKKNLLYSVLLSGLFMAANGAMAEQPTIITLNPNQKIGKVNPLIFGNNIEAGNANGIFGHKDTDHPRNGSGVWDPDMNRPVPEIVDIAKKIRMGMLRYPGGCLTHNFDWHKAVGARKDRTYFKFGIDEYIEVCRAMNVEPLMNVSELCSPEDATDLVEYLNMPAEPKYPWAMKRAEWGHKEPYHVKYFEMANESDHGNHDVKPRLCRSAAEYARWYLECAAAMRRMDKHILIGGHGGTGTPVSDPWNATVLKLAGPKMDFFAVHTYAVGGRSDDADLLMRGCMAATDQLTAKLADYHALIKKQTGKDIPLAVTEFNGGFTQSKPVPLRFAFGTALFCADYMREMLKPQTNVAFANYWQWINGFWGHVRSKTKNGKTTVTTFAGYPVFKLLGQHTGTELIGCSIAGEPKLEFCGFHAAFPARKIFLAKKKFIKDIPLKLTDANGRNYTVKATGKDSITVTLNKFSGESYYDFPKFPVKPEMNYTISGDLRLMIDHGTIKAGLGLTDARGWNAVKSACGTQSTNDSGEWISLETKMITRKDAKALEPVLRLIKGDDFTGQIQFRNIRIAEYIPRSFPPYSAVTAFATTGKAPKVISLIVFNKHHASALPLEIRLKGIQSVRQWTVSAPKMAAIKNAPDDVYERISGRKIANISPDGFSLKIPACSITAFEITLR